jgi:hypothetical protein
MNNTIRNTPPIKHLIHFQNTTTQAQTASFLQCIARAARKASPEVQPRQDVTAAKSFKRFNEDGFKPKLDRYLTLRNLEQFSIDEATKHNENSKEETTSNKCVLNLYHNQINSFLLTDGCVKKSSTIETPSHTSIIEWVNDLFMQIDLHASPETSTPTLKITLNHRLLPETEVSLRHTAAGWLINFKTSSSISYLQINQHIDNLKQRFRERHIDLCLVNLTMQDLL